VRRGCQGRARRRGQPPLGGLEDVAIAQIEVGRPELVGGAVGLALRQVTATLELEVVAPLPCRRRRRGCRCVLRISSLSSFLVHCASGSRLTWKVEDPIVRLQSPARMDTASRLRTAFRSSLAVFMRCSRCSCPPGFGRSHKCRDAPERPAYAPSLVTGVDGYSWYPNLELRESVNAVR
jgi:hypothetical protein